MLSYQHAYHAGNMADVHKHAVLAWVLDYMGQKPKPLSYFETHAGRGLYHLDAVEAQKTGEAAAGIDVVDRLGWFAPDHPFARALATIRATHGPRAYPGSPLIAAEVLRGEDSLRLAELHPQEVAALREVMGLGAQIDQRDGLELILSAVPPDPGRGVLLVDPPYEVKADYDTMAQFLRRVHRKWPVGVLILWYPILRDRRHAPMLSALEHAIPGGTRHEVAFPPAREDHGMVGSGLFIVNPPYGLEAELAQLSAHFAAL
ncbi:23S rRNA (adenine(2030)-N(6))-methyltransferase RlmJ [Loktanella sp. IMCC34160]|uniref:23S rRNA (adenine(2030)-N(6))-methyltransferase RlmJ n=1 Tax=Loktanella sp. IMCC34160 TaxID=2510646 RepID=UPI00101D7BD6|nr:23S rRNA (adenine(2030)-N(6))-methyltransferase RlmJ [Loktanella sp. IMCC34160]RYG92949.1 23S rRNA (adenine(2030)-N(6))-methyltransferase RlmJ [Loktanella sp. IMCC34160]